eukprot:tig00020961_g16633.t1
MASFAGGVLAPPGGRLQAPKHQLASLAPARLRPLGLVSQRPVRRTPRAFDGPTCDFREEFDQLHAPPQPPPAERAYGSSVDAEEHTDSFDALLDSFSRAAFSIRVPPEPRLRGETATHSPAPLQARSARAVEELRRAFDEGRKTRIDLTTAFEALDHERLRDLLAASSKTSGFGAMATLFALLTVAARAQPVTGMDEELEALGYGGESLMYFELCPAYVDRVPDVSYYIAKVGWSTLRDVVGWTEVDTRTAARLGVKLRDKSRRRRFGRHVLMSAGKLQELTAALLGHGARSPLAWPAAAASGPASDELVVDVPRFPDSRTSVAVHCPNRAGHRRGDRHPSLVMWASAEDGTCGSARCMVCTVRGEDGQRRPLTYWWRKSPTSSRRAYMRRGAGGDPALRSAAARAGRLTRFAAAEWLATPRRGRPRKPRGLSGSRRRTRRPRPSRRGPRPAWSGRCRPPSAAAWPRRGAAALPAAPADGPAERGGREPVPDAAGGAGAGRGVLAALLAAERRSSTAAARALASEALFLHSPPAGDPEGPGAPASSPAFPARLLSVSRMRAVAFEAAPWAAERLLPARWEPWLQEYLLFDLDRLEGLPQLAADPRALAALSERLAAILAADSQREAERGEPGAAPPAPPEHGAADGAVAVVLTGPTGLHVWARLLDARATPSAWLRDPAVAAWYRRLGSALLSAVRAALGSPRAWPGALDMQMCGAGRYGRMPAWRLLPSGELFRTRLIYLHGTEPSRGQPKRLSYRPGLKNGDSADP